MQQKPDDGSDDCLDCVTIRACSEDRLKTMKEIMRGGGMVGLLPKRITYGWFLDKRHTESSREKCDSQSVKQPNRTLNLEELELGRKPCIIRTCQSIRFDDVDIVLFKRLRNVHVIGMHCVA